METKEIKREEWCHFLDDFSKVHQGERAALEVSGEDVGAQPAAQALPFVGISAEDAGSEKNAVEVFLGTEPEDHIEHLIRDPTHLWLKTAGNRGGDVLEIEAADGTKTLLQLEPAPLLPR